MIKLAISKSFIKRSTAATAAHVMARATNTIIPFVVLASYQVNSQTDHFFFALAIAFYFYGTLSGALIEANVPLALSGHPISAGVREWRFLAVIATTVVILFLLTVLPHSGWLIAAGAGVMVYASIASVPAISQLYNQQRYTLVGITWSARLIAVAIYLSFPRSFGLGGLFVLIGVADITRALILHNRTHKTLSDAKQRADWREFSYFAPVVLSSSLAGLTPLIDRTIAATLEVGALSTLEVADRLYGLWANIATAGIMIVLLTDLSRRHREGTLAESWQTTVRIGLLWSCVWMTAGFAVVIGILPYALKMATTLRSEQIATVTLLTKTYLLGLPAVITNLIMVRRLIAMGSVHKMVPISLMNVLVSALLAVLLGNKLGIFGIALASVVSNAFIMGIMFLSQRWLFAPNR